MRILHLADLHLGRSLCDHDLLEDQRLMLESALAILVERRVDVLLVAGDIYDRSIPQSEAIQLFDGFLTRAVQAVPGLVAIAIPGNHDSAARLSFGSGLLAQAGFYLRTRVEDSTSPILVEKGGKRAAFWALPFVEATAFEAAIGRVRPLLESGLPNVLVAHCFAQGGSSSESERSFIGTAEEVSTSLFEGFDYVALGHLHRRQAAGPVARYPGSPLAYSFSEAAASPEKGFLLIELHGEAFEEEFLPVQPLHRLVHLEGSFADLSATGAFPEHRGDFVEVRLNDPLPVLDPADPLKANFPNLLAVRQAAFERVEAASLDGVGPSGEAAGQDRRDGEAVLSDFRSFYAEMKGNPPGPETEALFAELLKEADDASH
jgi:DNA repair protein SbcD/Mre11